MKRGARGACLRSHFFGKKLEKCWIYNMEAKFIQFISVLWSQITFFFACHFWELPTFRTSPHLPHFPVLWWCLLQRFPVLWWCLLPHYPVLCWSFPPLTGPLTKILPTFRSIPITCSRHDRVQHSPFGIKQQSPTHSYMYFRQNKLWKKFQLTALKPAVSMCCTYTRLATV